MLRKTVIALLAAVALASPTMALARGGGGYGHGDYAQGYYGDGNGDGSDASASNPCAYAGDTALAAAINSGQYLIDKPVHTAHGWHTQPVQVCG